jgi:hypothetical protein
VVESRKRGARIARRKREETMDKRKIDKLVELARKRRANPTDDRLRNEHMALWKTMTGGEQAAAVKLIKADEAANPNPPKEAEPVAPKPKTKEPVVTPLDPTQPVEKKSKPEKPKVTYNWDRKCEDKGRRVFTSHGTAVVLGEDKPNRVYLVRIEETEAEKVIASKSVRFKAFDEEYRDKYTVDKSVRTASGAYSVSNGDDVAKSLNGLSVEQLAEIATRTNLTEKWSRWEHVNPGMKRMNLSNVLRGLINGKDEAAAKNARATLQIAAKMPRVEAPAKKKAAPAPEPEKKESAATTLRKKANKAKAK